MLGGNILETMVVRLVGDSTSFIKTMVGAENKMMRTADRLVSFGKKLTLGVSLPLIAMGAGATREFAKFDQAMTESISIMSGITDEIRGNMEDVAKAISTNSAKAPEELARSYFFLASAGKDAAQSMALLPAVERFAIAGAFDMALATDLLTDAQSALGMSSKDAQTDMRNMTHLSDVLVKANTLANASVEQFSIALTSSAGSAIKVYNKSLEEGMAVLAAYADQGIKAELAGHALDRVLRLLGQSALDNAAEHEILGFSVYDSTGKMRNMADIVENLENITAGMSDETRNVTLDMLGFEARVQQVILPLLGTSKAIRQYEKDLMSAGGTTDKVAGKQMESFSNQMTVLRNQITVVAIEIGEMLAPSVLKLNKHISAGLTWWRSLDDAMKMNVVTVAKYVAVLGPTMLVIGNLTRVLALASRGLRVLGAVGVGSGFSSLASGAMLVVRHLRTLVVVGGAASVSLATGFASAAAPIFAVVAVVGAVVGAVAGLIYLVSGPAGLSAAWDLAKTSAFTFFDNVIGFIANLGTNLKILYAWIGENWKTVLTNMAGAWITYNTNMLANVGVVLNTIIRLYTAFAGWFAVTMGRLWERVFSVELLVAVVDAVGEIHKWFGQAIVDLGNVLYQGVVVFHQIFGSFVMDVVKMFAQLPMALGRVLISTAPIIGKALKMILLGQIPNPAVLLAQLSNTIINETAVLMKGMQDTFVAAGTRIGEALPGVVNAIGDKYEAASAQLQADYAAGAASTDILDTFGDIIAEEMANLRNPFDGVDLGVTGPELELDHTVFEDTTAMMDRLRDRFNAMRDGATGVVAGVEEIGGAAAGGTTDLDALAAALAVDTDPLTDASSTLTKIDDQNKDFKVNFSASGIDAVEAGTVEAFAKWDAYQASFNTGAKPKLMEPGIAEPGIVKGGAEAKIADAVPEIGLGLPAMPTAGLPNLDIGPLPSLPDMGGGLPWTTGDVATPIDQGQQEVTVAVEGKGEDDKIQKEMLVGIQTMAANTTKLVKASGARRAAKI